MPDFRNNKGAGYVDGRCLEHRLSDCMVDDGPLSPSPFPNPMDGGGQTAAALAVPQDSNANGANIPIPYGTIKNVGVSIADFWDAVRSSAVHHRVQGRVDLLMPIGMGEIESVDAIKIDGNNSSVWAAHFPVITSHTGAFSQAIDSHLDTYVSSWIQTLPGIAYLQLCARTDTIVWDHLFKVLVDIKGMKRLWNPTTAAWTTAASSCPALIIADLLANKDYAAGFPSTHHEIVDATDRIDWASVVTAQTDFASAGWTFNALMLRSAPMRSWIDTMRQHAPCWVFDNGETIKVVADKDAASSYTFYGVTGGAQHNSYLSGTAHWGWIDQSTRPDIVEVVWYDVADSNKQKTASPTGARVANPNLSNVVRYDCPGCNNETMANALAVRAFRHLTLPIVEGSFDCKHPGLRLEKADVITLNGYGGLPDGTKGRVMDFNSLGDFSYRITWRHHLAAVYA